MELKKKKHDGEDSDGLLEAGIRKKLIGIMSTYDLLDHYDHIHDKDNYIRHMSMNDPERPTKAVFSDKKLNRLWNQAEHGGFSPDELKMLREEFAHHQDKIDQYHALFEHVDNHRPAEHPKSLETDMLDLDEDMDLDRLNEDIIQKQHNQMLYKKSDILRHKHNELLDGYRELESKANKGPLHREFSHPKVEALWQTALHGNFSHSELDSLKLELKHYQKRLNHLQKLQHERNVLDKLNRQKNDDERSREAINLDVTIEDHAAKVFNIHRQLEDKIASKHNEL
ncbi:alpha-2-macroglobulin receptor-associated protein isoform X2 [Chrysoperla carnea]|nr:alpha-2-macroglobulin receptor-associated protein isoform X2 [Chrysoperla carnea]